MGIIPDQWGVLTWFLTLRSLNAYVHYPWVYSRGIWHNQLIV